MLGFLLPLITLFALGIPAAAYGKFGGPFRIVTPTGRVYTVRGHLARAWEAESSQGNRGNCPCGSPKSEAQFAAAVARQWGEHPPTPSLIIPLHGLPSLYYPQTAQTPAYVYTPNALCRAGDCNRTTWANWRVATLRMRQILSESTSSSPSQLTMYTAAGGGSAAVAALMAFGILRVRRRARRRRDQ